MHLTNTLITQQYSGFKHAKDETDTWLLTHLLCLSILLAGWVNRTIHELTHKQFEGVEGKKENKGTVLYHVNKRNNGRFMYSGGAENTALKFISIQ